MATANGGSGNYSCRWAIDGSQITGQNAAVLNYTFSSTGQHSLTVNVTDSLGITVTPAATIHATLYPAFMPPALSCNLATLTQTQTSILTAQVTTGTPTHLYKWYLKSPNDASYVTATNASLPTYNFNTSSATSPGTWSFKVQVTDATGEIANSTALSIMLNPLPTVTIAPATTTLYVGQNQQFNTQPAGGSGTYTSYQWYVNCAPQGGETASTFMFAAKAPASYTITVTVTDNSGVTGPQSNPVTATFQTAPTPTPTPNQPSPTPSTPTQTPTTLPTQTPTATPTAAPSPTPKV
jgi:hypothetical protein